MPYQKSATTRVEGLEEVLKQLDEFPKKLRNKHLKKAVNDASKTVLQGAKARCPRESGLLRKSLGRKVKVYRHSGVVMGIVGARLGFKQEVTRGKGKWKSMQVVSNPVKYLHLVELGTTRTQASHFLRDALQANLADIGNRMRDALANAVADLNASGAGKK